MCHPAAGGTSDRGHCCRCVVSGVLFLWARVRGQGKNSRTRHATRPPAVPMVEGDAEGGGGGDLTGGPWTDRRTGVRTPDDDERQPWRIPLDRPCLLPYSAQKFHKEAGPL